MSRHWRLHTRLGNPLGQANDLGNLGIVARDQGDYAAARTYLEQALELHTRLGNPLGQANQLGNLGTVASDQGDYAAARTYLEQALELHTRLGNPLGQANQLGNLGIVAINQGDYAAARTYLERSATLYRAARLARASSRSPGPGPFGQAVILIKDKTEYMDLSYIDPGKDSSVGAEFKIKVGSGPAVRSAIIEKRDMAVAARHWGSRGRSRNMSWLSSGPWPLIRSPPGRNTSEPRRIRSSGTRPASG